MIRAFLITAAVAVLSLVTFAGVSRVKPRPVCRRCLASACPGPVGVKHNGHWVCCCRCHVARPVDALERWRVLRDARKAGL